MRGSSKKQRSNRGGSSSSLPPSQFGSFPISQYRSLLPNAEQENLPPPVAADPATVALAGDGLQYKVEEEVKEVETIIPAATGPGVAPEVGNYAEGESEEEPREVEGVEEQDGEEEGEEEEEEEEDGEEMKTEEGQRPKLAEGFYEIEAIRKRRIFKGERQYLIKWRGWPESANTWEPLSHLQYCPDVVDAFERSLLSGQKKAYRKRKRKFTAFKKKVQNSYGGSRSKGSSSDFPLGDEVQSSSLAVVNDSDAGNLCHAVLPSANDDVVAPKGDVEKPGLMGKEREDSIKVLHPVERNDENNGGHSFDENASVRNLPMQFQEPIYGEGEGPENGLSKADHKETEQNDHRRGAKRRKSGSVRRFKQDSASFGPNDPVNAIPLTDCYGRVEQVVRDNVITCDKNSSDLKNDSVITRIIKPISFSSAVSDSVQDVLVTFAATRADGSEVMVDNKFLKTNYPALLINFYEQHLRYSPTS